MTPIIHTGHDDHIVVYLATRNIYDLLPAAYNSLLAYNHPDHVYILIEDDTFPHELPYNVTAVNVSDQDIFGPDGPNYSTRYTYMILLKAAMTKIFPDAGKVLVLDADTIVGDDISQLWDLDLNGSYFAATTEPKSLAIKGYPYPNFGCVLLNLDYLRQNGIDDEIIMELNTQGHQYPEQDAFVLHCGPRFYPLPSDYNYTFTGYRITDQSSYPRIIHYAGYKDWSVFDTVSYWQTHTTPPNKSVVYIGNRNYYHNLIAAAKSLMSHTHVDDIYFLIEDDSFPDEPDLPPFCHCINVSDQTIFSPDGPNINKYYTYMTLLRAALTKLIPDRDTVLLLDPDTVVVDNINALWNYDLQNYYFAAVLETRNNDHTPPYYNAGVMLLNLRKLRTDHKDDIIIDTINTTKYRHMEQDVLNFLCCDNILSVPSVYNASFVSEPTDNPRIIHYLDKAKKDLPAAQEPYASRSWDDILKGV